MRDSIAVSSFVEEWLGRTDLASLIDNLDGNGNQLLDPTTPLAIRLQSLDSFSDRWDTRGGKERNEATELPLTVSQSERVIEAADDLGMRGVTAPTRDHYDHVLVLGGLIRACVARPRWAAHLVENGLSVGSVTSLGGHRELRGDELPLAQAFGMEDARDEFEALDCGTRAAFSLSEPDAVSGETSDEVGASWTMHQYQPTPDLRINVAAAPSSEPGIRRANTADTYDWFARSAAHLDRTDSVLCVTTSIYVPAQHAAALQMLQLPFGSHVETIGFEPGMADASLTQEFTATKYLLEIRSAVRAFRRLLEASETSVRQ